MRKNKKNFDFVMRQIPLIRSVCLHKHITNVGAVIACVLDNYDGKTLDLNHAIKHYNDVDYSKIIFENGLNSYNVFYVTWNDIKSKTDDLNFGGLCYANNLDAGYIRNA
ncbi:MAG: hypothetical protein IKZ64_01560 [Alphaproteobacteria bacterium]|nr:hypothetical protein [Alphaproteobacteria bacterium]